MSEIPTHNKNSQQAPQNLHDQKDTLNDLFYTCSI